MENLLELMGMIQEHWGILVLIASVAFNAGLFLRNGQWKKAAKAMARVGHIVYSAVEEAGDEFAENRTEKPELVAELYSHVEGPLHDVKMKVREAVEALAVMDPGVVDAESVIRMNVDPKRNVPPIKRFWRRVLSGENFVGVALRVAGKAAAGKIVGGN